MSELRDALEAAEFALSLVVDAESDNRAWFHEAAEARETARAALAASAPPPVAAPPFRDASISAELVAALGDRVDWGRPDAAGVYHPTAREAGLRQAFVAGYAHGRGNAQRLDAQQAADDARNLAVRYADRLAPKADSHA